MTVGEKFRLEDVKVGYKSRLRSNIEKIRLNGQLSREEYMKSREKGIL